MQLLHLSRRVKIILVIALSLTLVCACGSTAIFMLIRSFFNTDPVITAFIDAGIRNDPTNVKSMLSSQTNMTDADIQRLFEQRELFEDFSAIGQSKGMKIYNYKIENMHIGIKGDLDYTNGKRGYYSADLVYQKEQWRIKSISMNLYEP